MEANEQGLTTEERIMFAVLGIILVIAIGVLTFNYFSNHERKIEGPNTTEVKEGERKDIVDNKEHITSIDNLKEESNDNSIVIIEGLPNVTKTSNITEISKVTKKKITKPTKASNKVKEYDEGFGSTAEVKEYDERIGSTAEGEVDEGAVILDNSENLDWTFNPNIVKESYANVFFKVPTTVNLTDGTEKETTVIIKDNNTGDEKAIENGEISLASGNYTYYYTCNNQTKELPLTIYNKLENTKMTFASVKDTSSKYSEEYKFLTENSTITNNENNYNLKIKRQKTLNEVFLKVTLPTSYSKVESNTNGITVSNNPSITDLNSNEFIIVLNLNSISLTKTNKVILTIDGVEYLFNFNVSIENVEKTEEENKEENKEENPDENPEEDKNNNQDENKKDEEKDPEPTPPEPTPEEETVSETNTGSTNEIPTNNNLTSEVEETPPDISLTTWWKSCFFFKKNV